MILPPAVAQPFWLIYLTLLNACAASHAEPERWWVMVVAIIMWPAIALMGKLLEALHG